MANEFIAKDYTGGSVATTLAINIAGGATSITVTSGVGMLDGSGGPFVITINRGQPSEEKILIASRAGNVLTVLQRGYDGTAAVGHNTPEPIEHTLDAWSIKHANTAVGAMTTRGDMVSRGAGLTFTRIPVGAANTRLGSNGTDPSWSSPSDIQNFSASGTWNKPSGPYTLAHVLVISAGFGAKGGARGTLNSVPGSGGYVVDMWIPLSALGASETITVGPTQAGGAGATVDGNFGTVPGYTGTSSIGTKIVADYNFAGCISNRCASGGTAATNGGTPAAGGTGQTSIAAAGGAGGTTAPTAGSVGTASTANSGLPGGGGGGGGQSAGAGAAGGAGGVPGAGGGAGGNSPNGTNGGAGGAGAAGFVQITCI